VLLLVYQTNEDFPVWSDVFDRHFNKKLYVIVLSIQWIFAVNDTMLIGMMPFPNNSVIWSLNFKSLGGPLWVKFVKLVVFVKHLGVKALSNWALWWWNLPVLEFSVKRLFSMRNHSASELSQLWWLIILERGLDPVPEVTQHIDKRLPIPVDKDSPVMLG